MNYQAIWKITVNDFKQDVETITNTLRNCFDELVKDNNTFGLYKHLLVDTLDSDGQVIEIGIKFHITEEMIEKNDLYYITRLLQEGFRAGHDTVQEEFSKLVTENNNVKIHIISFGFEDIKWEDDKLQVTVMLKFSYRSNNNEK